MKRSTTFTMIAVVASVVAVRALAQSQSHAIGKRSMHHATRAHAAYAYQPAQPRDTSWTCWVDGDKGAIDHGVFGYYASCDTPGAVPATASMWGPPRY